MKRLRPKFIGFVERKELEDIITSEDEFVWADTSFLRSISSPRRTIGHAIHGNYIDGNYLLRGIRGTAYAIREDTSDTISTNIDSYSFFIKPGESLGIIFGLHKDAEYHHPKEPLPGFLKATAPKEIVERAEMANKRLQKRLEFENQDS